MSKKPKPIVTNEIARKTASSLGLDLKKYPLTLWKFALTIELEHGRRNDLTNVTNDDMLTTAKIALAHIKEYPDYYQRLKIMEQDAEKYWKKNKKPNLMK